MRGERISVRLESIEGTIVRIRNHGGQNIFLMALYLRPHDNLSFTDLDTIHNIIGPSALQ